MRILALDHGTKRVGVAMSDELGLIAQPLRYLSAAPFAGFLAELKTILAEYEVALIVVGLPRNMDGSYGPAALKVQEFVAALKGAMTTPIETMDERLTTVQAQRVLREANVRGGKQKGKLDPAAAALLLQAYLDRRAMRCGSD